MVSTRPRWSSRTKLTVSLLILAFVVYLMFRFSEVVQPIIFAFILAYILSPIANWFEAKVKIGRGFATLLAFLVAVLFIALLFLVVVPPLVKQASSINVDFQRIIAEVESLLAQRFFIMGRVINISDIFQRGITALVGALEPAIGRTLTIAVGVLTSFVWIVFIIIISFYLVKDGKAFSAWIDDLVSPVYRNDYFWIKREIGKIWKAFFLGQLMLSLIVASIWTVIGTIIGLPFSLMMGLLAGLLEFLPSIGHTIWLTIAAILAFFLGSTWMHVPNWVFLLIVIGIELLFDQFDMNYLIPRVVGRRLSLPPIVVIIGIVIGALFGGFLGIFLASPTIASARVIGRYIYANLFDMDPFPAEVTEPLPPPKKDWWKKDKQSDDTKEDLSGKA